MDDTEREFGGVYLFVFEKIGGGFEVGGGFARFFDAAQKMCFRVEIEFCDTEIVRRRDDLHPAVFYSFRRRGDKLRIQLLQADIARRIGIHLKRPCVGAVQFLGPAPAWRNPAGAAMEADPISFADPKHVIRLLPEIGYVGTQSNAPLHFPGGNAIYSSRSAKGLDVSR